MTESMHVTDLCAGYALGALTQDERAIVDAHVADCAECRRDLAEMNATAAVLPLACPEVEPRAELGTRIVRAAANELQAGDVLAARADSVEVGAKTRKLEPRATLRALQSSSFARALRTSSLWFGAAGAAAAIVMGFITWNAMRERDALRGSVAQLSGQIVALRVENAQLDTQVEHGHAVMAALAAGDYWMIGPSKDERGSMRCVVVQPPARGRNAMLLASFPEPPRGMAYQVWMKRDGAMHKVGMVMHGGMSMVDMDMPVRRGDVVAFSVEPMQGSAAPTSPLLMESVL